MPTTSARLRSHRAAVVTGAVVATVLAGAAAGAPAGAAEPTGGEVYVIHAVAGPSADLVVDGDVVRAGAAPKTVVGPLSLAAGEHVISFNVAGQPAVTATVDVAAGQSMDVVAHQQADPSASAVLTVFPNDLSPVAPDKARLVVAHTAVVPPADVRVDGNVLFSNVANGEALTLVVPGGTYNVDIVPAATTGPVVFGPVALAVAPEQLNRVYAFGSPDEESMDAIVRTQALPVVGAELPGSVQTGNGGQAAAMADRSMLAGRSMLAERSSPAGDHTLPAEAILGLAAVLGLAGVGVLRAGRRRRVDS